MGIPISCICGRGVGRGRDGRIIPPRVVITFDSGQGDLEALFRKINVQRVPSQRVEDVMRLMSVLEVQNVGDVPDRVALGILGLDVEEDVLWL